jgi:hypothetical protein
MGFAPTRCGRALTVDTELLDWLSDLSARFSGAEIEQAVVTGRYDAFAERRPLSPDDLIRAVVDTVALVVTQAERLSAIRRWAQNR